MKLVYMTITGQTRKLVRKLDMEAIEVDPTNPYITVDEDFILISPSYEVEATDILWDFMDTGANERNCKGVIGAGNRNFANLYCFTAKNLAVDYELPYLHELEFQGSPNDLATINQVVEELANGITYLTPKEQGYTGTSKSNYITEEIRVIKKEN